MSGVPLIPRRKVDPAQAEADLARRLLSDLWTGACTAAERNFAPREYNNTMTLLHPSRALLTRIAGTDSETTTTPGTVADACPDDLSLDGILAIWIARFNRARIETTAKPLSPKADQIDVIKALIAVGYLTHAKERVQWTAKATAILIASGTWSPDGLSEADLSEDFAKASAIFRARQTRAKAQALLDSMPATLHKDFTTLCRSQNVVAAYDWLYAHYSLGGTSWRTTPRPVEAASKPGKLNHPDVGLNVAVEMYDIASGGWMTTLKTTPPAELKELLMRAKRGQR